MAEFDRAAPTYRADCRHRKFHTADDGMIELWVWQPDREEWERQSRRTKAELDRMAGELWAEQVHI